MPFATEEAFFARLFQMGIERHCFFHLAGNITQHIVFEILGRDRIAPLAGNVPFLVTDSPLSVSSEDIICPDPSGYSADEYRDFVEASLASFGEILGWALGSGELKAILIAMSEGWSPSYAEFSCTADRFADTCMSHREDDPGLDSALPIKVLVRP